MNNNDRSFAKKLRINQTDAEKLIWHFLRAKRFRGVKFKRQSPIGKYIVDFVAFDKKVIVELDGGQHNIENRKLNDEIRTKWLESQGFIILRFWNNDVIKNIDGVLEAIRKTIFDE